MPNFVTVEILKALEARIEVSAGHIVNDGADTFEEYKFLTGRIAGLKEAIEEVMAIDRRYEEDDQD